MREKAIEYVSTSLMSMRHILFIPHPENEKHIVAHVKKVLQHNTHTPHNAHILLMYILHRYYLM